MMQYQYSSYYGGLGIQAMRLSLIPAVFLAVFGIAVPEACYAQGIATCPEARPILMRAKQLELTDVDRNEVLSGLVCLAVSETNETNSSGLLRALFHAAQSPREIQSRLFQVVDDPRTSEATRFSACQLLIYVVDAEGRGLLLRQVKEGWEKTAKGGQLWALIELGDLGCLSWLEEVAESMDKDDPRYIWILEQITRIRAQHDSTLLLELLQSGASYVESSWLLRQGVRNGVDVALLRQAVLDQVAKAENGSLRMKEKSIVGQVGLEFGVLTHQDISEHSTIKPLKIADEGQWPKWATLVDVKRTQFYRGKSNDE